MNRGVPGSLLAAPAALACRDPAVTPSARPLADFPFATATPDCAPGDGPAVSVLLTTVPQTAEPVPAPFVRVSLYAALEGVAHRTVRWPTDTETGGASWCPAADDCVGAVGRRAVRDARGRQRAPRSPAARVPRPRGARRAVPRELAATPGAVRLGPAVR